MILKKIGKILFFILLSSLLLFEIISLILIFIDYFDIYYVYAMILNISGFIVITIILLLIPSVIFFRKIFLRNSLLLISFLSFVILMNFLIIYKINVHRRFIPYLEKIEIIAQSDIRITPEMQKVIVKVKEENFYNKSQFDYIIGEMSLPFYMLFSYGNYRFWYQKNTPQLSSSVAITLMRDEKNINLDFEDMGYWHLDHFIWTFALNEYFSKEQIIHMYCYYFFYNQEDIIEYCRSTIGKEIYKCKEDDILKLMAFMRFPGNNKRGTNDIIMSLDNVEEFEEMRIKEYQRLKELYYFE